MKTKRSDAEDNGRRRSWYSMRYAELPSTGRSNKDILVENKTNRLFKHRTKGAQNVSGTSTWPMIETANGPTYRQTWVKYKERCNGPSLKTQESQLKGRFFFFYRVTEKHERNSYAQTQPQDSSAVFNFLPSSTPLLSALPCLGADGPVLLELQARLLNRCREYCRDAFLQSAPRTPRSLFFPSWEQRQIRSCLLGWPGRMVL